MAWRMIMRRVPTRSLTVVGDVAQTGNAAGARSWGGMLDRYVRGRWREERLTVNYRTPAEIMTVATDVLAAFAPDEHPPESVREEAPAPARSVPVLAGASARVSLVMRVRRAGHGGAEHGPDVVRLRERRDAEYVPRGGHSCGACPRRFRATVAQVVDEELAGLTAAEEGRLAVIAPAARLAGLAAAIPSAVTGDRADALESPVALLTVAQAKGLEFDRVVLADPAGILAQSPKGGHDLYVAITRATHRLAVVHEGELPPLLSALTPSRPRPRPLTRGGKVPGGGERLRAWGGHIWGSAVV